MLLVSYADLLWIALAAPAAAQSTARISLGIGNVEGQGATGFAALAPDGRWAVFESLAPNLVPGDANGVTDVFLRDLDNGTTELASASAGGLIGDGDCFTSVVAGNGRYVAFGSFATNLVPGDANGVHDMFLRDRQLGTVERITLDSNGNETHNPLHPYGQPRFPRVTGDGRFVVYNCGAFDLVPGDTNATADIFLRDRTLGTTEAISVGFAGGLGNGESIRSAISNDGRFVAYASRGSNLVANDTNGTLDIFVRDRLSATTSRASLGPGGVEANGPSLDPSLSSDGSIITFASSASNLVGGDTNGTWDVFVLDGANATMERVSVASTGSEGNAASERPKISSDGRFVVFESAASNLVASDTNGVADVFVHDRYNNATERVSVATSGAEASGASLYASVSRDGTRVVFSSLAPDLVGSDLNGVQDAFVRDRGPAIGVPYCFGDGTGTACPCGNASTPSQRAGCTHSLGGAGTLVATGIPRVSADTVVLSATGMPDSSALYFQGTLRVNGSAGGVFGDGLRCAGGSIVRLGLALNVAGRSHYPDTGDAPIAVQGPIAPGSVRTYQVWFRNAAAFCTSATYNLTNGWEITWQA